MAYEVLARTYRPQRFDEVVGQEHVTRTLQNAVAAQRVAHAYLFSGPRGIGKTSLARILAKAMNCEHGLTPSPCGTCSACQEIAAGRSLDVLEIDAASNRGVDNIRDLRETVGYAPARGQRRVYIIDEAHQLTGEAFSALLKTLEEPPAHVLFVLATTEPQKVPRTIVSRCQSFAFRRIREGLIRERLSAVCVRENISADGEAISLIAREADGSLRDALGLLDQVVAFAGPTPAYDDVRRILGALDRRILFAILDAVADGDAATLLGQAARLAEEGYEPHDIWQRLAGHVRDLVVAQVAGADAPLLDRTPEEQAALAQQAGRFSRETLDRLWDILDGAEVALKRSADPRAALDMLLVRLADVARLVPATVLLERLEALEARLSEAAPSPLSAAPRQATLNLGESSPKGDPASPVPPSGPSGPPPRVATGTARPTDESEAVLAAVRRADPRLAAILEHGRILDITEQAVVLGFDDGGVHATLLSEASIGRLAEIAADVLGRTVSVHVRRIRREDVPAVPPQAGSTPVLQEPVKAALTILGGRLVTKD